MDIFLRVRRFKSYWHLLAEATPEEQRDLLLLLLKLRLNEEQPKLTEH
jgi:hypothetical protein